MVNEVKRLNQVIDTLEDQAVQVTEFRGVLKSVKDARESIESSKATLNSLSKEQKALVADSYQKFKEFGDILTKLEKQLAIIQQSQAETLRVISELKFVTIEQFDQGLSVTEGRFVDTIERLTTQISETSTKQQSVIHSLKKTMVIGMLILAGGILFLAKDTLL